MMLTCILSVFLTIIPSAGSFLLPLQERDSVLIADQVIYGFELKDVEAGTVFFYPDLDAVMEELGIMKLSDWQIDTVKVYRAKKGRPATYDMRAGILLTTFEEGEYDLPSLAAMRQIPSGYVDTLLFDPLLMTVFTIPIDEEDFELHDIKGQVRYPLTLREVLPWVAGSWLFATIVIAIVCLLMMRKRMEGGVFAHNDPAHIVALRKLDRYRGDKYWAAEKQKTFYSGVTDALREYMVSRYGISAMEMTTAEIFAALQDSDMPKDLYGELEELFRRSDFVKFAKYVADRDENAGVVPLAVRFVTSTYQTEVEDESEGQDNDQNGGNATDQNAAQGGQGGQDDPTADAAAAAAAAAKSDFEERTGIPEEHSKWVPKD